MNQRRTLHTLALGLVICAVLYGIIVLASYITNNEQAQLLVQQYGVWGVLVISFIAGLNVIVPVPAAAFVPIFTSSGLGLPLIIVVLVIGTMLADFVAYGLGRLGRTAAANSWPKLQAKITASYTTHRHLLPYLVFGFAGFVPIPNDVWLIPLGLLGIKVRVFIIPLLLGTVVYQTLSANGVQTVFDLFF